MVNVTYEARLFDTVEQMEANRALCIFADSKYETVKGEALIELRAYQFCIIEYKIDSEVVKVETVTKDSPFYC